MYRVFSNYVQCTLSSLLPEPRWFQGAGRGLLPEDVGVFVGITISKSIPQKLWFRWRRTNAKRWRCSAKRFQLSLNLPDCLSASECFAFEVKKLQNGKKDLQTVKSEAQNRSKKTVAGQKRFAGAIVNFSPEENGLPPMPIRCCVAQICYPGSMLHILIKISLSSWTARSQTPPFPLQEKLLRAGKMQFCRYSRQPLSLTVPGAY